MAVKNQDSPDGITILFRREYNSFSAMWHRCTNPRDIGFSIYGGRGISVCERWGSFKAFLSDMGPRPQKCTLDRIDPNGNYEPGNCRWATKEIQAKNIRPINHSKRSIYHRWVS